MNAQVKSQNIYKRLKFLIKKLQTQLAKYKAKKGDYR